jgi:long-chain acyl-CoA synthetase
MCDTGVTVSIGGVEKEIPLRDTAALSEQSFPPRKPDDLVSIVYTSGSLGNSKGVMLSNRNLVSCALAARKLVRIRPKDRLLSVLPLAHTYECTLGLLNVVISGAKISYLDRPPSPTVLLSAARAVRPTAMITVPLLIEKIYRSHIAKALNASPLYRCVLTKPLAIKAAGRKLKRALGGSLRFFGIGGAPLSAEVERFLRKARFPYAPGYGLTEAAPVVTGTAPYRFPCRSSGSGLPGLDLRITPVDSARPLIGEIQVRGPNMMMGYYKDEEKTREAFTPDGWLRTGDIGSVGKKRKLYIRGRLKALILSPNGENIYPEEIEGLLSTSDLVEDALVFSGEKGELVAMIHISESARLAARFAMHTLEKKLEELRLWANKKLAAFSRLSRIELREEPFEKTPTFKIKRHLYVPSACT